MGYAGLKREQFFLGLSVPLAAPERWWDTRGSWPAEGQDCSWGKLNEISDSLQ
jgi:hypothetical protein